MAFLVSLRNTSDYFLYEYMKDLVYRDLLHSLNHLKNKTIVVFASIIQANLQKVSLCANKYNTSNIFRTNHMFH